MYCLLLILLIIKSVLCIIDLPSSNDFYYTNYLMSDVKKIKLKSCNSIDDCDAYASECVKDDIMPFKHCKFEFYCRNNYACFLGVPLNDTSIVEKINIAESNSSQTNKTNDFYNGVLHVGGKTNLKMISTDEASKCSNSCTSPSDCYSENCVNGCCRKNDKLQEYICGPQFFINKYKATEEKQPLNITSFEKEKVTCKLSNYQTCSKDNDCYSYVCDYSGLCLDAVNKDEKQKFKVETIIYYIFIAFIFLLIISVFLCSMVFNRKANKVGKGN